MVKEITISEEVHKLQLQLDSLKRESSKLWEQIEHMLSFEKHNLYSLYQSLIGQLQYDEFALKTEVSRLRRKAELLQAAINRNGKPDETDVEKELDAEFEEYTEALKDHLKSIEQAKKYLESPSLSEEEAAELHSNYLLVAKKLHPDINPDITPEQNDLFIKATAAYKDCNLNALRQIVLMLDISTVEELPAETLEQRIQKVTELIESYKNKIEKIESDFPFTFKKLLSDQAWVENLQNEIKQNIELLKSQKEQQSQYVQILLSWQPELLS